MKCRLRLSHAVGPFGNGREVTQAGHSEVMKQSKVIKLEWTATTITCAAILQY